MACLIKACRRGIYYLFRKGMYYERKNFLIGMESDYRFVEIDESVRLYTGRPF